MTDWEILREAAIALLSGQNPYLVGSGELLFFNPPWALIAVIPFVTLPLITGLLINAVISVIVLLFVARHLKLSLWEFFFIAISPMMLQSMIFGNIEWMPMLGLLFPAPLAMLFFVTKPQAALGWIILFLVRGWKIGRWKRVTVILVPTILVTAVSLTLWGLPPIPGTENPGQYSFFPISLLLGIPALIWALKNDDERIAGFVGPFMAPYVSFHGYIHALFALKGKWLILVVMVTFLAVVFGMIGT